MDTSVLSLEDDGDFSSATFQTWLTEPTCVPNPPSGPRNDDVERGVSLLPPEERAYQREKSGRTLATPSFPLTT